MWTGFPSPFIQLLLLFGNGVFGTFPDFPALGGSEIKPSSITPLPQETGKGSEGLEAVVVFPAGAGDGGAASLCGAFRLALPRASLSQLSPPHPLLCGATQQQSTKLLCPLGPLALRWLQKAASPVTGLDLILGFV